MKRIIAPLTLALVTTSTYATQENAIELSQHLSTIEAPEPIKRIGPKYPMKAAQQGRSGWARLSFVIDEKGEVSDVLITETSGSADFAKAAKRAIVQWKYKPAMENGKPIQQCVNNIQMDFSIDEPGSFGVTKRFRNKYKTALQALKDKDYAQVETYLEQMKSSKRMHVTENNLMHLLAADYAHAINDDELALFHLTRAAMTHNDKVKIKILPRVFNYQIKLSQFKNAYDTYNKIAKIKAAKAYLPQFQKILANVDHLINNKEDIILTGKVKEEGYWQTRLMRNEFSLANIDGTLERLDIRCANKRHEYTVESNNTWALPSTWKDCSVYVFGKPETQFKFIEHPLKS